MSTEKKNFGVCVCACAASLHLKISCHTPENRHVGICWTCDTLNLCCQASHAGGGIFLHHPQPINFQLGFWHKWTYKKIIGAIMGHNEL